MIRIVKMTFYEDKVDEFLSNFEQNKKAIRNFEGVEYLELLQDKDNPCCYFTYSVWKSEEHLEQYRGSDLFKGVWAKTKPLFAVKAQAWSTESIHKLP